MRRARTMIRVVGSEHQEMSSSEDNSDTDSDCSYEPTHEEQAAKEVLRKRRPTLESLSGSDSDEDYRRKSKLSKKSTDTQNDSDDDLDPIYRPSAHQERKRKASPPGERRVTRSQSRSPSPEVPPILKREILPSILKREGRPRTPGRTIRWSPKNDIRVIQPENESPRISPFNRSSKTFSTECSRRCSSGAKQLRR